jgi:RHS repeat-associated protein
MRYWLTSKHKITINKKVMEENKNQDRAQERAAFYCDTGTKLYRTVAEARNEYTYTVTGAKLRVVHRWNPAYSNSPVIGSAVNAGSLTEKITVDYAGNKIYKNGALKKILTENGYYENGKYYFYIRDHLGNNRILADQEGNEEQSTQYYPFGMVMRETNREKQAFKFGGKEYDEMHGLNWYDFHARYYFSIIPGFLTIDPMAEKYPWISTYAYCGNNPVNFFDPNGMDVWEINDYGEIVNRMKDKTQDAFYMVAKDNEGNYQRTFTTDADGNKNYNSISFEYGTVTQSPTFKDYDKYTVSGNENGTKLFEFLADNTKVEWGNIQYYSDNSTITTSHHESKLTSFQDELMDNFQVGVISLTHSHPQGTPYPSGLDNRKRGDIDAARKLESRYGRIKSYIYLPGNDKYVRETYIPYNSQSQYWDFRGHPNNHWLPEIIITAKPKK